MKSSPLLINEPPLQVLPTLAQKIGLNEAIIIQQVHYWLNPKFNENYFEGQHWVRNTYEQWQQQFPFWGIMTIRRAITKLEELGLLMTFVTRDFKKTKYYSINYRLLENLSRNSDTRTSESAENQGTHPSVQNDQIDMSKATNRDDPHEQTDLIKVNRSYNKDTENTPHEITIHPPSHAVPHATNEEEEVVKKLIKIWNETVQSNLQPGSEVYPTSKRISALKSFITKVLHGNPAGWQTYCDKVSQIRFLMGQNASGFKVTLDWALVPGNAFKILEGAIYDKPSDGSTCPIQLSKEDILEEFIETPWGQISQFLIDMVGVNSYKSWFATAKIVEMGELEISLQVDSGFTRDYIISHFIQDLERAVQAAFPSIRHILFQIKKTEPC